MAYNITIDPQDKQKILNIWNNLKIVLKNTVKDVVLYMHRLGVQEAPIDTWFLRKSFFDEVKDTGGIFSNSAEYAPYVNFGTSRQKANPFMERIRDKTSERVPEFLQDNFKRVWL